MGPRLAYKTDEELMEVIGSALQGRVPVYSQARLHFNAERLESYEPIEESEAKRS